MSDWEVLDEGGGWEVIDDAPPAPKKPPKKTWGEWAKDRAKAIGQGAVDMAVNYDSTGRAIGQGLTFGYLDEGLAAAEAALTDKTYDQAHKEREEQIRKDKEKLGWGYTIAEGASMIVPGLGTARLASAAIRPGAGFLARAGAQGGAGAIAGGVQDYGTQQGNKSVVSALPAAALGGGLGVGAEALTGPLARWGGNLIRERYTAARELMRQADHARHGGGPLPISRGTEREAIRSVVNDLERSGLDEAGYQAAQRAAQLPGESVAAPALVNDRALTAGLEAAGDLPGAGYGGRGNMADAFTEQSLSQGGRTQHDLLKERLRAHRGLPENPATRQGQYIDQRTNFATAIERTKNSGGPNTRVRGISAGLRTNDLLFREYQTVARNMGRNVPDVPPTMDNVDLEVITVLHQKMGENAANANLKKDVREGSRRLYQFLDNTMHADPRSRATRVIDDLSGIGRARTLGERMEQGMQYKNRAATEEATALAERQRLHTQRNGTSQHRAQSDGTIYGVAGEIDKAAAKGSTTSLADDLVGTPDKRTRLSQWSDMTPAQVDDFANDLTRIGVREDVADDLRNALARGGDHMDEGVQRTTAASRAIANSRTGGSLWSFLERAARDVPASRKYQIARLYFEKTAEGNRQIMEEYARRRASAANMPREFLSRARIIDSLSLEAARGYAESRNKTKQQALVHRSRYRDQ